MSRKYHLIPTIEVIDHLRVNGFHPVRATQGRTRLPGKQDYTVTSSASVRTARRL
jgi:hypothetical protein